MSSDILYIQQTKSHHLSELSFSHRVAKILNFFGKKSAPNQSGSCVGYQYLRCLCESFVLFRNGFVLISSIDNFAEPILTVEPSISRMWLP